MCIGALVASCSKEEPGDFLYTGEDFVSFERITTQNISIAENAGSTQIKISLSRPQSEATTVTVSVEEIVRHVGYTIPSNQVVIPAGQVDGSFVITPIDDNLNSAATSLKVTITAVTPNVKIGMREAGSYTKNITIVNDDCPSKFNIWFGTLSVEDVGYGPTAGSGAATPTGLCDILVVTNNLPGIASPTNSVYRVTLTPSSLNSPTGTAVVPETISRTGLTAGGVSVNAVYSATGTYNETTKEITLNYSLVAKSVANGSVIGTYWTGTNIIRK